MLFQTTQAHEQLRAKIRAFAEEEVKPIAFSLDQANEFPAEAVKKLGELGLMGIPYPKEYGGAGLDAISWRASHGGCTVHCHLAGIQEKLNAELKAHTLEDILGPAD